AEAGGITGSSAPGFFRAALGAVLSRTRRRRLARDLELLGHQGKRHQQYAKTDQAEDFFHGTTDKRFWQRKHSQAEFQAAAPELAQNPRPAGALDRAPAEMRYPG